MSEEDYKRGYLEGFHDGRDSILHPEKYKKQITEDLHDMDHPDWGEITCNVCNKVFKGIVFHACTENNCPW